MLGPHSSNSPSFLWSGIGPVVAQSAGVGAVPSSPSCDCKCQSLDLWKRQTGDSKVQTFWKVGSDNSKVQKFLDRCNWQFQGPKMSGFWSTSRWNSQFAFSSGELVNSLSMPDKSWLVDHSFHTRMQFPVISIRWRRFIEIQEKHAKVGAGTCGVEVSWSLCLHPASQSHPARPSPLAGLTLASRIWSRRYTVNPVYTGATRRVEHKLTHPHIWLTLFVCIDDKHPNFKVMDSKSVPREQMHRYS